MIIKLRITPQYFWFRYVLNQKNHKWWDFHGLLAQYYFPSFWIHFFFIVLRNKYFAKWFRISKLIFALSDSNFSFQILKLLPLLIKPFMVEFIDSTALFVKKIFLDRTSEFLELKLIYRYFKKDLKDIEMKKKNWIYPFWIIPQDFFEFFSFYPIFFEIV